MGRLRSSMLIATIAAVGLLGACGNETADSAEKTAPTPAGSPSASAEQPASDLPPCDDVWIVGDDLPGKYKGCTADGTEVTPETVECSSGQRIVVFDDQFWAVRGHVIKQAPDGLDASDEYADVLYSCRA